MMLSQQMYLKIQRTHSQRPHRLIVLVLNLLLRLSSGGERAKSLCWKWVLRVGFCYERYIPTFVRSGSCNGRKYSHHDMIR
jgi:hypothetical protein